MKREEKNHKLKEMLYHKNVKYEGKLYMRTQIMAMKKQFSHQGDALNIGSILIVVVTIFQRTKKFCQ